LPSLPPESEAVLLRKVTALAKLYHWRVYHTHRSDRSEPGWPDVALCKRGRPLILAELKTARGRLSEAQQGWLRDLATCDGVRVAVWRPADLEQIAAVLAA
jgi:hypothetical protein